MSADFSYAIYVEKLTANFCMEMTNSAAHRESIDKLGLAVAPFDLSPCVSVHHDGELSLMAVCHGDAGEIMQQMIQADYEVGVPIINSIQYVGHKEMKVPVAWDGIKFTLYYTAEVPA